MSARLDSRPFGSGAPVRSAGLALGIGMGGLADGIALHQMLQVHNMLSARVPSDTLVGSKVNMFADGVFHAGVWTIVLIGIALLWRAVRRPDAVLSTRVLVGSMLMGWGVFNFIEGIIDHHILQVHHVVERLGMSMWDYAFLASGLLLVGLGWSTTRGGAKSAHHRPMGHG